MQHLKNNRKKITHTFKAEVNIHSPTTTIIKGHHRQIDQTNCNKKKINLPVNIEKFTAAAVVALMRRRPSLVHVFILFDRSVFFKKNNNNNFIV